jgi:ankyrin repeat protein
MLAFVVSGCCWGVSSPTGIGVGICFPPRPRSLWLWRAVAEGSAGPCAVRLRDDRGYVDLAGIACPEGRNEYLHEEAADAIKAAAAGRRVRVKALLGDSAWDWSMFPPNKTRGYVFLPDGVLLNEELLRGGLVGLGKVDGLPDAERLRAAEREARAERRGRWHGTWTPLQQAAADGDAARATAALEAGDDPNARDPFGYTPLMLVLAKGDPASTKPDCALAELLLAYGADPEVRNNRGVARADHQLDACFVGPWMRGRILVVVAAARRRGVEGVRAVADKGFPVNMRGAGGSTPLGVAATLGDATIIRTLIAAGADMEYGAGSSGTALALAVHKGRVDAARALIAAGASVKSTNGNGETPLMLAAAGGNAELIEILRAAGADPRATDRMGWNAIRHARTPASRQALLGTRCPEEDDPDGSKFVWRAFERAGLSYPYIDRNEFRRLRWRQDGPFYVLRLGRPQPGDVGVVEQGPGAPVMIADPEADRAWDIDAGSDAISVCGPQRSVVGGNWPTWFRFRGDLPPDAAARVIEAARGELRAR